MLFDNSGSVTGGNDPIGNRYVEAAVALDRVRRSCRCRKELGAILHFDTPTSGDVAPTTIAGKSGKLIDRGLAVPLDGAGASTLTASLRAAEATAAAYPSHLHTLVVFSDFQLFDPNLVDLLDEYAGYPGVVHAVVLRSSPPDQLVQDSRVKVTTVDYTDPPGAVAQSVLDALTVHRPDRHLAASS